MYRVAFRLIGNLVLETVQKVKQFGVFARPKQFYKTDSERGGSPSISGS